MMNVLLVVTLSKTDDLEKKSKIMQTERMVNEIAISQMKPKVKWIIDLFKCRKEFVIDFEKAFNRKVLLC